MSAEPEVLDADVVPEQDETQPIAQPVSTALAPRQRRSEVIRPLNTEALVESFGEYQELLPKLLDSNDWQDAGRGKRFVKKSGWRKIATAFDLDVQIIRSETDRDDSGQPTRAEVWARAIAPSGRFMDGDGYCSVDEERFSGPRGNKSKLENDLRATATTRAMNRAISGLVGMGDVSAEEVDASAGQEPAGPVEASVELKTTARNAISYMLDGDERSTANAWDALTRQFPTGLPRDAGQAIVLVISTFKARRELAAQRAAAAPSPSPGPETNPDDPGGLFDTDEARAEAAGGHYGE